MIAFIGSVFSPYYAMARRRTPRGHADPLDHCAFNLALYGDGGSRWCMTERGRHDVQRDSTNLRIGPSACHWDGDVLTVTIDEIAAPWPARIRGTVRVQAPCRFGHAETLATGHRWFPIAPRARVEVDLASPHRSWTGSGYLDANQGDRPLEQSFERWNWSRAHLGPSRSVVVYDIERADATRLQIGLQFDEAGATTTIAPMPAMPLPRTGWRIARGACGDAGSAAVLRRTLTDAPFYARSLVDARWLGEPVTVVHESLSLARFDTPWVQAMLPFRMPRRAARVNAGNR